jgi:hypothetical protein
VAAGNPAKPLGTVEDYERRHRERMATHPRFEFSTTGLTPERVAEVRRALEASGRIYMK